MKCTARKYDHILTKEYLLDEHVVKKRSLLDISKEVGCYHKTVADYLHLHCIPQLVPTYDGRKMGRHANWKGHGELSGTRFKGFHNNAKTRGIEFTVTIEYLWQLYQKQEGKCALTGRCIGFLTANKATASLDRKDPKIGYIPGNVWWVHLEANYAKQSMTTAEFIALCSEVIAYSSR